MEISFTAEWLKKNIGGHLLMDLVELVDPSFMDFLIYLYKIN